MACSGGCDSVSLVSVLSQLQKRISFGLAVAHVHHGGSPDADVSQFRVQAQTAAYDLAQALELPFFLSPESKVESVLRSEEELREHRLEALEQIRRQQGFDWIAFAHHADDLFETRLIRLIRGTGAQGLTSMTSRQGNAIRPFLSESRDSIRSYAEIKRLAWVEDPSNLTADALRNWLRQMWLPALEVKRPGASASFQRSLERIVEAVEAVSLGEAEGHEDLRRGLLPQGRGIDRHVYKTLGIPERRQVLATYLRRLNVKAFGFSHIEEIRKRIEISRKVLSFELLKLHWDVNAQQIHAKPRSSSKDSRLEE